VQDPHGTGEEASRRALLAGSVGNLVEWYDFALYGAFATVIAATFFPDAALPGGRASRRGLSLTYGLGSALFGGTAPALATFLVRRTGDALSPAWYATGLTVVAIACVLAAPETAGRPLDAGGDRASELRR
jgi:hypothetical protein